MSLVEGIHDAVAQLDEALVLAAEDDLDPEMVAEVVHAAWVQKSHLTEAYGHLCDLLVATASGHGPEFDLLGGARIEIVDGSPRKKWQHQSLISDLGNRIVDTAFDFATGEMRISHHEMATEILRYANPTWRVRQLKAIGIDPNAYCEVGDPKTSVIVRGVRDEFTED
jgi:hypothetical protein